MKSFPLPAERLSQVGLIYRGIRDDLIGSFHQVEGYNWCEDDDSLTAHMDWCPKCSFFKSILPYSKGKTGLIKYNSKVNLQSW